MIKFIASDIDGTLVGEAANDMPQEMFGLIRQLKEMGILFAAASGRQYSNMRRLFAPVASDIVYICENGGLVIQDEQVLHRDSFDRTLMEEIVRAVQEKEGAEFSCSVEGFYYMQPKTQEYYDFMKNEVQCDIRLIHSLDEITRPCMKVAVYEKNGVTDESINYWRGRFGDRCKVMTSGSAWVDFAPKTTNKAVGIQVFQKKYGFGSDECVTFGDEYNDVEMLSSVKYGFAMAHAKPGVRARASYVTECEQDILRALIRTGGDMEKIQLTPSDGNK